MRRSIEFKLNGTDKTLVVEPWWSLAYVLREELSLTGTKVSCDTGHCGSCTVLVDDQAVKSCLYLAVKADGKSVLTIEGLCREDGGLHPVQEAFIEHFAVQCGYCTPGMILTAKAFLDESPQPTEDEIRNALSGNICRCTGYVKIVEAIMAVSGKQSELYK